MAKLLKKKDIALSAQFGVRMVDNYVPLGQIADEASAAQKLDLAGRQCALRRICCCPWRRNKKSLEESFPSLPHPARQGNFGFFLAIRQDSATGASSACAE